MKIDRLVSIIMLLLDRGRVGAGELAELFEVSPRTIYRDIDAINLAGIPVRATPGVGGGFEIMPEYKIDQKVFSAADLSTLLMGLSSLSHMGQGEELSNALAKVKSLIPADRAGEIQQKADQIRIDLSPWTGSGSTQPYLERVKTAIQEHRLLTFGYITHHGNTTARTVEPYQLVLKNSHWYLQGYCHTRNQFRLFRLSRMSDLGMSEEIFAPRAYQTPQLEFTDILETMQIGVRLRIHRSILDRVLEHCPYENVSPDGDAHYLVDFPFMENDYHYDILLSFGDKCECLEPPHVRENMKRKIQAVAALYT